MKEIQQIFENPNDYLKRLKAESERRVIGYFCSYVPEEIILASGAHPVRLFGSGKKIWLADAHLQSYCCSLVRGALENALSGEFAFLDGAAFPHTCDSIQRLSDIWRLNIRNVFHLDLILPVRLDSPNARRYFIDVLNRFRDDLERTLGASITDDGLRRAIAVCNRIRKALMRIDDFRGKRPGTLRGSDFHVLTRAAMTMDRYRAATLLEEIISDLENKKQSRVSIDAKKAASGRSKKRIILAGGACNHPDVYMIVEDAQGAVVGDDLCTGSRFFSGLVDENDDPMNAIAGRLMERIVCPAKHRGLTDRADRLVRLAREKNTQGVVIFLLKFCDPHAFDYPYLKEALDREGIPAIFLEAEDQSAASGQIRTRLEAFMEMI